MKNIIFGLFSILVIPLFSHEGGVVSGFVSDGDMGVPYVQVFVKGTKIGTTTDDEGNYELKIPTGNIVLIYKSVGFKTVKKKLSVNKHDKIELDVVLKEDILGLDQVVVTGKRGLENRKEASVIVTVTDAKILEATQSVSLSEGLNFQPGLRMETNCQNCGFSQVRMNGLDGAYSQILIDSRPVFSALNGVYGLDQIPANIISRIEVVRGGGSALYGANAIAGTINIITKDPVENTFQVSSNLAFIDGEATDRSIGYNGTIVNEDGNAGLSIFGLYRDRDPFDMDGDGFTEITTMQNNTFGAKGFYRPGDRKKFTAEFHTIHEFRRGGDNLHLQPFESEITEQISSDVFSGGLTYEWLSDDYKTNISVYGSSSFSSNDNYYGGGEDIVEQGGEVLGYGNTDDTTFVLGGQYAYEMDEFLGGSGSFTGGVEYKYDDMSDAKPGYNAFIDQILRIYGVYAQQEWKPSERLKVLAGIRADFHNLSEEDVVVNPRLNVLYNFTEDFQFRASYARGFRAPQVFTEDVHSSLAAGEITRIVNADGLVSETSDSFVASIEFTNETLESDFRATVEGFYTLLNDPFILEDITVESDNQQIWEKRNGDGAKIFGANVELQYAPNENWQFQMGGTIQQGKYDEVVAFTNDTDVSLENADNFFKSPNVYGNMMVTFAPKKSFQNNLTAVYTGSMYVPHLAGYIAKDVLEKTNDFLELNWKSSYGFDLDKHFQLELSAGIQNIFNSYQSDFDKGPLRDPNYIYGPGRPRTYFIGLTIGSDLF